MTVTEENIQDLKSRLIKLWEYCKLDAGDYQLDDYVDLGEDVVRFEFPGDEEYVDLLVDDLIAFTDRIDSYKEEGPATVRCANISQTAVDLADMNGAYDGGVLNEVYETETFTVQIIETPFLIGIRNVLHNCYDSDYWSPCYNYHAAEFRYKGNAKKLPFKTEQEELSRFLFAMSVKHHCLITVSELFEPEQVNYDEDYDPEDYDFNKEKEVIVTKSSDLPAFSPMLNMYLDAMSMNNTELRFLLFYKIIEHVSPSISRSQVHKMLASRLDMSIFEKRDHTYYDSLLDLVHRYDKSASDSELASTVLAECCDLKAYEECIPKSVMTIISNDSGVSVKDGFSRLSNEQLIKLCRALGTCLYSTRNAIVHAKSNYSPTKKECPSSDLNQLNEFMQRFAYTIIMWNNRQADTMKV